VLKFALEKTADILTELQPLIHSHWEQVALNKDDVQLAPDWDRYTYLELAGFLRVYTARKDNELIGYFAVAISKHLHYKNDTFAVCDVLYVAPKHRKGSTGYKLIKYVETELSKTDVKVLHINTKQHVPFDKLLHRMGYNPIETIHAKKLG
jgi:GNAT superfamily N-acetyltransferase